jgi:plasmid stability protein
MPDVLVRNLDANVLKRLKGAAKAHGRSLQAEMRAALRREAARHLGENRRLSETWLKQLNGGERDTGA